MTGTAAVKLEQENHQRDADFSKAMHGKVDGNVSGFMNMINKNNKAAGAAAEEYFKNWTDDGTRVETEEEKNVRLANYATLTRQYYNIATDLYEHGWGESFHFCRFYQKEPFYQAIARHEHYLAHRMNLQAGMKILDVGCGVGGPAREIARFADVNITGLNNNDYQIARAGLYAEKTGLSKQMNFVKGDFMQMSFPPNTFDAVYAIEATVHAPSLEGVYGQIFKVLKPGGVFGVYEWVMTENFDETNVEHRKIRRGIEIGDGISQMVKSDECLRAIKAVGFEIESAEDLAERPDVVPWYYPIAGDFKYLSGMGDFFTIFRMTRLGRGFVRGLTRALEIVGIAPPGAQKTADSLALAADSLVAGGAQKLFTPMFLVVARKPLA